MGCTAHGRHSTVTPMRGHQGHEGHATVTPMGAAGTRARAGTPQRGRDETRGSQRDNPRGGWAGHEGRAVSPRAGWAVARLCGVTRRGRRCPGAGCRRSALGVGRTGGWRRGRRARGAAGGARGVSCRVAACRGVRRRGALGPVRSGFCRQPRAAAAAAAAPCSAERGLRTPRASGDVEVGVRRRRGTEPASASRPRPRPRAGADLPSLPRSLPLLPLSRLPGSPRRSRQRCPQRGGSRTALAAGPRGAPAAELGWGVSGGSWRKGRWRRRKSLAGGSAARPAARRRARAARGGGGAGAGRLPACPRRARPVLPARRPSGPAASRGWEGKGGERRGNEQSFSRCDRTPLPVPAARRGCAGSRREGWSEPPTAPPAAPDRRGSARWFPG